jgi:multidrug transporter EmrE-like cation transporter
MTTSGLVQLIAATVVYLIAATVAKSWAMAPGMGKMILTLALYTVGNVIMLRLIREFGMASAFSLTGVIQLVAVNFIAIFAFNEKLSLTQGIGVGLAVAAVALITLGPAAGER